MKKRVIIIFLTLLFTILAFGKVDLNAKSTDEVTQLEGTALSELASETEEAKELEKTPKDKNKEAKNLEEAQNIETKKETEKAEETKEKTIEEETPQVENKTKEKTEDQQIVSDAKKEAVDPESKEEEIKKDKKTEEKTEDTKKNAEAEVKTEEEKKQDETKEADAKTDGEKAKDGTEEKPEEKAEEGEKTEEKTEAKELKAGETLEIEELAENPIALGQGQGQGEEKIVLVDSFEKLKQAIADAGDKPTTIVITKSFTLTEALTIGADQDITLTADNKRIEDSWDPIKKPADYADQGEEKQREIIEEARRRGEEALEKADLKKNLLPSEDKKDIIIKRDDGFTNDTLFKVLGKLTLGTKDKAVYIDGNGDIARTAFDNKGTVIDVDGELTMKNAVIMNSYNKHGYTGPVRVNSGGKFTMEGGRISKNTSFEQIDHDYERPYAAGAVFVQPGGTFTMTNGLIDNNHGGLTGGVFAGSLWGSSGDPAEVEINGGIIANNLSATRYQMGGGLNGFPASKITITDGIIAGNKSYNTGGAIGISSQYIGSPSNVLGAEKATVNTNYENFIKTNKAEAIIDGGLIYKNRALSSGGGIYIDSNDVKLGKTMILDNKAGEFGGGIYVSFPPITQKLEDILITENKAKGWVTSSIIGGSNGGGLWNCPTGFVHIGDGHSVYVYNNDSGSYGKDITFSEKTWYFSLNGKNIEGEFYSHISPVTKDKNIIKFLEDGPSKENGVDIPERLSYHRQFTHLKAVYSEELIKEAWKNSKTFVLGNQARNGAGVGSNANITTPKDEGDYGIEVNKKWDELIEKKDIPKEIKADLFIVPIDKDQKYVKANYGKDNSLFKYGEITLGKENNWHSRFDTNYYNGANKEEILKKLGIKNFSDIGLPDDAYQMDKGLPFTAKELAEKGYKYMVIEQGDDFFVEYSEEKPTEDKTEKAGVLEITRVYNVTYDDADVREDKDIYLYFYDPVKQVLTRIGQTKIHEEKDENGVGKGFGKATIVHPLLIKKVSEYKYYGAYRKFTEYEGWGDVEGYHNRNHGYAIVLTENKDGTLTVEVPYLWLNDYYENVGFTAIQTEETQDYQVQGNKNHSFTLSNSPWGKLDVEKSWKNIKEEDQPKSIEFYLLLDGKRVIDDYDKNGKPIYKKLTLREKDEWKGSFEKLDPKALAAGKYSLEEDSDIFAPEFINNKEKFRIRIGYANTFHEEGQAENETTSTGGHFRGYNYKNEDGTIKGIKLNLYLDGKKVDTQEFTFTVDYMPEYNLTFYDLKKNVVFKELEAETYGQGIPVRYYDVISNEPNLYEYNFYLKRDENGAYALYLPRLVINGVPYADLFIAEKLEPNPPYDSHERTTIISPQEAKEDWQIKAENHYGPDHMIEFLKQWLGGDSNIPDEITVIVTNEKGEIKEIKLTKEGKWQETIENLKGTLRKQGYSIKEVEVPGYTGAINTEKAGLKVVGKDKDGKEIILNYMTDEIKKVLAAGNYRYEVFELSEEDKNKEFNEANLNTFIKVEKQNDGRYIIRYAKDITLTEVFAVNITNTEIPPEPPTPRKTFVRVRKVWQALGETKDIKVELYINGEASGKFLTLNEANDWSASFTNLDIEDDMGNAYIYTVKEVGEKDKVYTIDERKFEVSYSGDMYNGFTIVNKEVPPEEPPTPPEEPEEPEPEPPTPPTPTPPTPPEEHIIPKTGVSEDVLGIFLALMILIGLVYIKKKYILKKSK
ncbi:Cna B-type domain-containing protein [Fenollaria massiliensis]|uniref:Cna B-type domain-containing protein n=1 Tax=Fenollaria massiliensis TaxID=938288 RepID=A0A9E7IWH8_9FIRM|nr:Cna B-type domain-containing protein [Fenollaria massiliensis]UQK58885.1 Cna B-type domain-containing protein [Fenollaria massiliensis]